MERLNKYEKPEIELKNHLTRIGDLINMDGPMLILFQDDRNKDFFLFDWVDGDDLTNRWIIFKVRREDLTDFVCGRISYKRLFERSTVTCFFADIESGSIYNYQIIRLLSIPPDYFPDKEVLFDYNDAKNLDAILAILNLKIHSNRIIAKEYNNLSETVKTPLTFNTTQFSIGDFFWQGSSSYDNKLGVKSFDLLNLHTQKNVTQNNRIPSKKRVALQ